MVVLNIGFRWRHATAIPEASNCPSNRTYDLWVGRRPVQFTAASLHMATPKVQDWIKTRLTCKNTQCNMKNKCFLGFIIYDDLCAFHFIPVQLGRTNLWTERDMGSQGTTKLNPKVLPQGMDLGDCPNFGHSAGWRPACCLLKSPWRWYWPQGNRKSVGMRLAKLSESYVLVWDDTIRNYLLSQRAIIVSKGSHSTW